MSTVSQIVRQCETLLAQCVIAANEAAQSAFLTSGAAPLNSPAFTGEPTAPTAELNNNSSIVATTAYLDRLFGASNGLPTLDATGHIPLAQLPSAVTGGLSYLGTWNASTNAPHLTSGSGVGGNFYIVQVSGTASIDGTATWNVGDWIVYVDGGTNQWQRVQPTYASATNIPLASLATQAGYTFVMNATGGSASPTAQPVSVVMSLLTDFAGTSGTYGGARGLVPTPGASGTAGTRFLSEAGGFAVPPLPSLTGYALLASPAFTGTPTTATIARATSSTALATAEFVIKNLANSTEILPVVDGTASQGTSTYGARVDHIHPTDTSRVAAHSGSASDLGLSGTCTVPTQSVADNSTKIASTAYADAAGSSFPSGTKLLFRQTAAPTGWTKDVTYNDVGLRVVSGTVGSVTGATAFSTVFSQTTVGGYALTTSDVPALNSENVGSSPEITAILGYVGTAGASHAHTVALNLNYVDVIIATKN